MTDKIAIYCRVSSDEQTERGTIENQRIFAEKYIELHDLAVHDFYLDDGVTGTLPLQERPAGKRLLDDAKNGKFNLVLFYKLDRLGRATRVILNAVAELKKYGVDIRSMTEPFDTSTPSGQFTLTMFAGIAELDRENILARMRQGTLNYARKGKWIGGNAPYGYKVVDGYLAVDDEPIEGLPYSPKDVVLMIFDILIKEKVSTAQIAHRLNALGIPPRFRLLKRKGHHSGKWYPAKVAGIIHNTVYYGLHIFGKDSTCKDKVTIEQECPALITKEIWDEAQECLKTNAGRPTNVKQRTYMLRGLIRCGNCGATYCGSSPRRENGGRYYRCHNKGKYIPADLAEQRCQSRNIRADWLETLVWQDCLRYIMQPEIITEQVNADDGINRIKAEAEALKTNLSKIEQERKTAVNLCIKGIISEDDLAEQLNEIDSTIKSIKAEIGKNEALLDGADTSAVISKLNKIKARLADDELDEREKQIIVQELVEKIIVTTPENDDDIKLDVEIIYKFRGPKNDCKYNPYLQDYGTNLQQLSTIGEKLRHCRCSKAVNIQTLAELVGIYPASITEIELGHVLPKPQTLKKICSALDIPTTLITEADRMPEDTLQERYEKARMLECLTKKEISRKIGVAEKTIIDMLTGDRSPRPETLEKIEKYCNAVLKKYAGHPE